MLVSKTYPTENKYTKMSAREAFDVELNALPRLKNYFRCECGAGYHFPEVVNVDYINCVIYMTYCGNSLRDRGTVEDMKKTLKSEDVVRQIRCIMNNLRRASVKHSDCTRNGQNICYSAGKLSLIDFDIALVKGIPQNKVALKWANSHGKDEDYYKFFGSQLLMIINNICTAANGNDSPATNNH